MYAPSTEFGFGRRNNTNNCQRTRSTSSSVDDDDVDVLFKSIYYYDPKELAKQTSIKLFMRSTDYDNIMMNGCGTTNGCDDPLTRYYEFKERLNEFMWTLEDTMLGEEAEREESNINPIITPSSKLAAKATPLKQPPNDKEGKTTSEHLHPSVSDHHHYPATSKGNLPEEEELQYPPLECIRRISESGYLTSTELGRLLLLTTPKMIQQLTHDFVWTCLCQARFGPNFLSSLLLPIATTSTTKKSKSKQPKHDNQDRQDKKEWLFRQLCKGIKPQPLFTTTPLSSSQRWPTIEPSNLQSKDLQLLLSWYPNKHQAQNDGLPPIITLSITGRRLNEFLQRGQVTIPVKGDEDVIIPAPLPQNIDETYVRIHAIRRRRRCDSKNKNNGIYDLGCSDDDEDTYYQTVCIHETEEHSFDDAANDRSLHNMGDLYLGPNVPILLKQSGKDLETRLARGDHEPGGFEILVIGHVSSIDTVAKRIASSSTATTTTATTTDIDDTASANMIDNDDDNMNGDDNDTNQEHTTHDGAFHDDNTIESDDIDDGNNNHSRQRQQQEQASQQQQQQQKRIIKSISLQFWANYSDRLYIYNSREESQKHGVTMLHILDQLDGWT